ncbi:hypothetical protein FACS189423_06630 [Bacteroidia bacterium]|nr:hypothetical protein FACS189423_06630 [Bacteroidia bacterium]
MVITKKYACEKLKFKKMKMKKMIFLMLTLFFLGAASMNAQLTIGSTGEPHPAAVLDLKSTTQGMILPNVTLSNNVTDFNLSGDKATAKGLVVYNTGDTPGIYIWDGASWNRLNSCTLPSAPSSFIFNPLITNPVAPHALITISVSAVFGATSYDWTLPDSLSIEGIADGSSIRVRVLKTIAGTIDASGISVAAVNACGTGPSINATGTITVEAIAPVQPTFSISRTSINSNGTVTLTCQDVGADRIVRRHR